MSEALLVVGHPERYTQFLDHLGKLGYRAVVLNAKIEGTYRGDHVELVSADPNDTARLLEVAAELHAKWSFCAVLTHHELSQYAAELVARHLGLPSRDPQLVRRATNKYLMKQRFEEAGVPTARVEFLDLDAPVESECARIEQRLSYPLVIKPVTGLFSVGVTRVDGPEQLRAALPVTRRIARLLKSSSRDPVGSSRLVVEEYIHGQELNVDGFTVGGVFTPLMSAQKYPDLHGPTFQENALVFADCADPVPSALREIAERVVRAFPFPDSPFHIEVRREEKSGEYFVVEMAPRLSGMGSTIHNMMLHATGLDMFELLIEQRRGRLERFPAFTYKNGVLEYDTLSPRGGKICGFPGLERVLAHPDLLHADILKSVGEVLAPPAYNLEAVAVFYLRTKSHAEALSQISWLDETFGVAFEA